MHSMLQHQLLPRPRVKMNSETNKGKSCICIVLYYFILYCIVLYIKPINFICVFVAVFCAFIAYPCRSTQSATNCSKVTTQYACELTSATNDIRFIFTKYTMIYTDFSYLTTGPLQSPYVVKAATFRDIAQIPTMV